MLIQTCFRSIIREKKRWEWAFDNLGYGYIYFLSIMLYSY